jgi:hypothetical protein
VKSPVSRECGTWDFCSLPTKTLIYTLHHCLTVQTIQMDKSTTPRLPIFNQGIEMALRTKTSRTRMSLGPAYLFNTDRSYAYHIRYSPRSMKPPLEWRLFDMRRLAPAEIAGSHAPAGLSSSHTCLQTRCKDVVLREITLHFHDHAGPSVLSRAPFYQNILPQELRRFRFRSVMGRLCNVPLSLYLLETYDSRSRADSPHLKWLSAHRNLRKS